MKPLSRATARSGSDHERTPRALHAVDMSATIVREVVGLRPFRQPGFRVEAEVIGDTTVIHNYGHGGGGITLSWGTAHLAAMLARDVPQQAAAVLGCGAVGLATARLLQQRGFTVTIYARDLPPNTTSNIAGGQWGPHTVVDADRWTSSFEAQFTQAARFAFAHFQTLLGTQYGVAWRENFLLSESAGAPLDREHALIADLLGMEQVPTGEHPFGRLHVTRFMTMQIESPIYLAAMLEEFRLAGGKVVVRELADRVQISELPERLVVNCTGLGAASLFDDKEMLPISGQLVVLAPQPEVDYVTLGPGGDYMIPRQDGVLLGGTHGRGSWSTELDPRETERILRTHRRQFAAMRQPSG